MTKFSLLLVLLMALLRLSSCQSQEKAERVILNNSPEIFDVKYLLHKPSIKVSIKYYALSEIKNESIIDLLSSILSARNQEWVDFNTLGGSQKSKKVKKEMFDGITNIDSVEKKMTYLDLKSQFEFTANKSSWAITKFYVNSPQIERPFSGFYLFQKVGNRWYLTSTPWASNLAIMLMSFDDEKLATVFKGKPTGNPLMDDLIKKVYRDKTLDLNTLFKEYDSWYKNEDKQRKDYFLDKNAWTY